MARSTHALSVDAFLLVWNNTTAFGSVDAVARQCHMTKKQVVDKAFRLRSKMPSRVVTRDIVAAASDTKLISMYRKTKEYPTVKDIAVAVGYAQETVLVRISRLRRILGSTVVPYRGNNNANRQRSADHPRTANAK
jgi:hypothetical protein